MTRMVRITYLEMGSREELRPASRVPRDVLLLKAAIPSPELGRFLYTSVGGEWYWRERLGWTWKKWHAWLSRPEVETWVAYQSGTPAGYFELEAQPEGRAQLTYFGLLPSFIGKGLGGYLLSEAIDRAWHMGPEVRRVWVHTCSLDHPGALPNYLARGFRIFKEEEHQVTLPEEPPGPWPGADRHR
jgi:GNAT superfamily N-acetyltransferase